MRLLNLILLAVAASGAQSALAHTELSESVPADQAVLETAPEEITLRFSEPVRLTALSVQRDGGDKRSLGPLPPDAAERFVLAAPDLVDGSYTVSWRALSADTHVMTGEFVFAIGAGHNRGDEAHPAAGTPSTEAGDHEGH